MISASLCILFIGCICILILTNGVSKEMKLRAELISHLDARRRAAASSNYKSQFLVNMNILICDDCLTNEQYSIITQIRKCSTTLLRLLNNILDLSKVSYKTSQLLISTYCVSKQARVYVHTVTKWRELVNHLPITIYQTIGRKNN